MKSSKFSFRSLALWAVSIGIAGTLIVILAAARGGRTINIAATYADVNYCTIDGFTSQLDVYMPSDSKSVHPLAVYVHGGGWSGGDKGSGEGAIDVPELVSRGYVVASLNYRLAGRNTNKDFPAQIEDVKCGIRFLRSQASQYKIDPAKVVAWGGSAGGHLVSLLGTSDRSDGYDVGPYLDQSSRVQAVVDYFGPSQINEPEFYADNKRLVDRVFPDLATQIAGSPMTHVSADDPPFMIFHGDKDGTVPLNHSVMLNTALDAVNVSSDLVVVKNTGHGFNTKDRWGVPSHTREEITELMADFLDSIVK